MYDLIVAGRYPDDRFCITDERTIDIFDSNSGELVFQLYDSTATGIKSVSHLSKKEHVKELNLNILKPKSFCFLQINKFSPMGDLIGSGMGEHNDCLPWIRSDV